MHPLDICSSILECKDESLTERMQAIYRHHNKESPMLEGDELARFTLDKYKAAITKRPDEMSDGMLLQVMRPFNQVSEH